MTRNKNVKWKKRGAKILGTWVLGFSGGLVGISILQPEFTLLILDAMLIGFVITLPQIGKMLIEYGNL